MFARREAHSACEWPSWGPSHPQLHSFRAIAGAGARVRLEQLAAAQARRRDGATRGLDVRARVVRAARRVVARACVRAFDAARVRRRRDVARAPKTTYQIVQGAISTRTTLELSI